MRALVDLPVCAMTRKLTPTVRRAIVDAVSAGACVRVAAESAGVSDRSLRSWLARGRAESDARRIASGERRYLALVIAVEQAGARAEVRMAALITRAAEEDWRAAAWFLARRDPENFGARVAVAHVEEPDRTFDELLERRPTRSWRSCKRWRSVVVGRTAEQKIWSRRVDRARARHAKEYADASHDFLRAVHGQPAHWLDGITPPTAVEKAAQREYMNRIGEISGAGPFPER